MMADQFPECLVSHLGGGSFSSLEQRANGLELYPGMELGQSAVTNGTRGLITNPVTSICPSSL